MIKSRLGLVLNAIGLERSRNFFLANHKANYSQTKANLNYFRHSIVNSMKNMGRVEIIKKGIIIFDPCLCSSAMRIFPLAPYDSLIFIQATQVDPFLTGVTLKYFDKISLLSFESSNFLSEQRDYLPVSIG